MGINSARFALLALWLSGVGAVSGFGQSENDCADWTSYRLLVRLDPNRTPDEIFGPINFSEPNPVRLALDEVVSERFSCYLVRCTYAEPGLSVPEYVAGLPGVINAAWDKPLQFRDTIPNDEGYTEQWGLEKVRLPSVWPVSTGGHTIGGKEIVLAILDKGFDLEHEDLIATRWTNPGEIPDDNIDNDSNGFADDVHGWNFQLDSPLYQVEVHGTEVAGVMGASSNNTIGIAAPSWQVKMMYLGVRYPSEVIQALEYVLDQREHFNQSQGQQGAFVVVTNGSFGFDKVFCSDQPYWSFLYDPLGEAGVLSVAPPANENYNVDAVGDVPATCASDYLITVTSSTSTDDRANISAYGPASIDLAAPGVDIYSAIPADGYKGGILGNSLASPLVAGVIGLMYSLPCIDLDSLAEANPAGAALLVKEAILQGVDKAAAFSGKTVTEGRLNAKMAMDYLHAFCNANPRERSAGDFKSIYLGENDIIRLYPNPAADLLTVEFRVEDFGELQVAIFNPLGQRVAYQQRVAVTPFAPQRLTLDVSGLPVGTYFISIIGAEKKTTEKFVKH